MCSLLKKLMQEWVQRTGGYHSSLNFYIDN